MEKTNKGYVQIFDIVTENCSNYTVISSKSTDSN